MSWWIAWLDCLMLRGSRSGKVHREEEWKSRFLASAAYRTGLFYLGARRFRAVYTGYRT